MFRLYAAMTHGTTVRDLCQRLDPATQRINERRLVQFGVLEGLIRRLESVSLSTLTVLAINYYKDLETIYTQLLIDRNQVHCVAAFNRNNSQK